ncbi:hypothetical protein GCM10009609_48290 [Pseudonocardia aurantiaca]|uniref:SDR family NAD(P)-dependent oxidoreductase n=1 Tax=Pseudonocardia aurantiaca TaxID=75290 RepID=A0ABW4G0G2_9PSEU
MAPRSPELAAQGARVAVADLSKDAAHEAAADVRAGGPDVIAVPVDVTSSAEVDDFRGARAPARRH